MSFIFRFGNYRHHAPRRIITVFVYIESITVSLDKGVIKKKKKKNNANTFITNNYRPIQSENHRFIILVT